MEIQLIKSVKDVIDLIIKNENFKTPPEIVCNKGSKAGDGYSSKTYDITIINKDNGENINLFVKYMPEIKDVEWNDNFRRIFQVEFKFYNEVYPAFQKFQDEKHIEDPFNNVPKHFGKELDDSSDPPPIVMENLQSSGYILRDRKKLFDDDHLKLSIIAFARYHALSYALRDQKPTLFKKLTENVEDLFTEMFKDWLGKVVLKKCVEQFIDSLNPVSDKMMLDRCADLYDILLDHSLNIPNHIDDYSAICQGDCWNNNMMFLYDENEKPIDVKIIDWQFMRLNSPLLDFSFFFFMIATKEILENDQFYLNLYYNCLSERIIELGSDPMKLYPRTVFWNHWKKLSLFGLTISFCTAKSLLFEIDEIPDEVYSTEASIDLYCRIIKKQDEFINRMKMLTQYFIEKKLL